MAKRRRQQQHLRQEPGRDRSYTSSRSHPEAKYKPEFPFNLLQNAKLFYWIGGVIMVGGVVAAALLGGSGLNQATPDPPTSTPISTPGTVSPSATPDGRTFTAAEDVTDAATTSYTATVTTAKGDIVLQLFAEEAPNTVNSFVFLAQQKYFDGLPFHRVEDWVVQTGDPTGAGGDGRDGPGYQTEEEETDFLNEEGYVAMAKVGGATSFGSQWYILLEDAHHLDGTFFPFGLVTEGMDVVRSLQQGDLIESVTITETPR